MDLHVEAERLRLDVLAVSLCAALAAADVPHALLKGPSTANWLYDPPRRYRDVDLLVPLSRLGDATAALTDAALVRADAGRPGEEAEHSLLLIAADGFEVDLHFSLPTVAPRGEATWAALGSRIEPLDLGVGTVPALDEPARCLVLVLHALGNAARPGQALEDLRRAREHAAAQSWQEAAALADRLGIGASYAAGLGLPGSGQAVPASGATVSAGRATGGSTAGSTSAGSGRIAGTRRARLFADGAPAAALGVLRLTESPLRELPRRLARELLPSRGFMARADPEAGSTARWSLLRAHLRRWRRLLRQLPAAARAWWRARG